MAIARNPRRNTIAVVDHKAAAFISGAGKGDGNKEPTMIRISRDLRDRIDAGAKRLGISRSAFIVSAAAEKLERMG